MSILCQKLSSADIVKLIKPCQFLCHGTTRVYTDGNLIPQIVPNCEHGFRQNVIKLDNAIKSSILVTVNKESERWDGSTGLLKAF